jgi:hypothetical protein
MEGIGCSKQTYNLKHARKFSLPVRRTGFYLTNKIWQTVFFSIYYYNNLTTFSCGGLSQKSERLPFVVIFILVESTDEKVGIGAPSSGMKRGAKLLSDLLE